MRTSPQKLPPRAIEDRLGEYFFWTIVGILACGVATALVLFYAMITDEYDPFDKFLVIGVESDPLSNQHAVTFQYDHADSSGRFHATWIANYAPKLGSTEPIRPKPDRALLTNALMTTFSPKWIAGRLTITIADDASLKIWEVDHCPFYDYGAAFLCYDPKQVEVAKSLPP